MTNRAQKFIGAIAIAVLSIAGVAAPSRAAMPPYQSGGLPCVFDETGHATTTFTSPLAGVLVFETDLLFATVTVTGNDLESFGLPNAKIMTTAAGETRTVEVSGSTLLGCHVGWAVHGTPANDAPTSAEELVGASGSVAGSTQAATLSLPSEPQPTPGAARVVWYRWTAPTTGTVAFDANPQPSNVISYRTTSSVVTSVGVAIYGPTDHVTPLQVGGDGVATEFAQHGGRVAVPVTAGTVYDIAVFSAGGTGNLASAHNYTAAGAFNLSWQADQSPTPQDDIIGTDAGVTTTVDVLTNDTDPESDPLSVSGVDAFSVNGGSVGRVRGNPNRVLYEPPSGFTGVDGFDYTVVDGGGATATAHVTVYVGVPIPGLPTIVPGAASVVEGDGGTTTLNIPVTLSAPSTGVAVQWNTTQLAAGNEREAKQGDDYVAASGTVMFAPGQTSATVPVTIKSDTLDEYDELFLVSFHNVANARLGGFFGLGFGGIADDDALPTIVPAFGAPSVLEGSTDAPAAIHVALSAASGRSVKAHYTMPFTGGDGVAEPGVDYDVASGDVVFVPGTTSVDIPVTVHGDTIPEEDELVGAVLSSPTNATIGGVYGIGAFKLLNDD